MISLKIKKYRPYATIILECGNMAVDLGMLELTEQRQLLNEVKEMVEELEWIVHSNE